MNAIELGNQASIANAPYVKANPAAYTIFIVEDSAVSRMMLNRYINKMPNVSAENKRQIETHTFENGEECLQNLHLNPDIVILDFYLSETDHDCINGLAVLKDIKKRCPSTKVIMVTSQQSVIMTAELFRNGASAYISKEHACHNLVEQTVIRLLVEIETDKRKAKRRAIFYMATFIFGIFAGAYVGS